MIKGMPGLRVHGKRPDAAITAARHVHANNKILRGIDQAAVAYQAGPPVLGIAVGRQRVKYPRHIRPVFVQLSESVVAQMVARQDRA